jgi:hypothetical protein
MPDVFVDPHPSHKKLPAEDIKADKKAPETKSADHALNRTSIMKFKPKKPGFFSAFTPLPTETTFENQEPDEEILLLLRKHFITNIKWILLAALFMLLPLIIIPVFFVSPLAFFSLPESYIIILTSLYYLIVFGYVLTQFATWFYQVGIITNYRIIDIDFNSLLSKNIAYTELGDIVDVESMQGGLLHNFFDYGTVQMQTEGLKANFEFVNIPKPTTVADTVSDLVRGKRGVHG